MFTCGLLRSNFSLLIFYVSSPVKRYSKLKVRCFDKLKLLEPKSGFEPETSSLPRMRSTPELLGPDSKKLIWSGRRDSNSRHSAWKADALPTELLPPISIWDL